MRIEAVRARQKALVEKKWHIAARKAVHELYPGEEDEYAYLAEPQPGWIPTPPEDVKIELKV
jgi:hypothetical protein